MHKCFEMSDNYHVTCIVCITFLSYINLDHIQVFTMFAWPFGKKPLKTTANIVALHVAFTVAKPLPLLPHPFKALSLVTRFHLCFVMVLMMRI